MHVHDVLYAFAFVPGTFKKCWWISAAHFFIYFVLASSLGLLRCVHVVFSVNAFLNNHVPAAPWSQFEWCSVVSYYEPPHVFAKDKRGVHEHFLGFEVFLSAAAWSQIELCQCFPICGASARDVHLNFALWRNVDGATGSHFLMLWYCSDISWYAVVCRFCQSKPLTCLDFTRPRARTWPLRRLNKN